jgi:hypothetical protein
MTGSTRSNAKIRHPHSHQCSNTSPTHRIRYHQRLRNEARLPHTGHDTTQMLRQLTVLLKASETPQMYGMLIMQICKEASGDV